MLVFSMASLLVQAQDAKIRSLQTETLKKLGTLSKDTSSKRWKKGLLYNLTFSQASLSNWSAGGDNFSLAVGSVLNLYANYKKDKNSWDNSFDFNFGYVNSTSLGSRKNDDRFDFLSKYGHSLNGKLNMAALINLRSQFFKGYTYESTGRSLASNLFAPGYFLQSVGFDYKPSSAFSMFFSPLTARWVFVFDRALYTKGVYGVEPGKKNQPGGRCLCHAQLPETDRAQYHL